ncbi:MAG: family 78 glycoside hydrolase catalytic domain [Gordonia sp. (in: high G+C Gram-positive bacteria)]
MSRSSTPLDALADALAITAADDTGRVPLLRRSVALDRPADSVTRAALTATAHGVYAATIGGRPVSQTLLNPGWTAYEHRLQVQEFDVTELVRESGGTVELEVALAGGWWRGDLGFEDANANYGPDLAFLAALEITYTDGSSQRIATGPDWSVTESAIELASIYHGQREDRRLVPGPEQPVRVVEIDRATLVPQVSPPIVRHETLAPQRIWLSPSGRTLVDFGQNLVGFIRFTVSGPAGTLITVRHAEVLEDGELGTRPLRGAQATDSIVLAGTGSEDFEPAFTFHGFRYAEVTGWPGELAADSLEAVVVHSDIRRTGTFESSNSDVNQLISNSVWSQKGNFLAVPTDCPQRDERLGWTGDIAAYAPTAAFQFDVADFLHGWLLDLAAETAADPNSYVPYVIPDILKYAHFPAEMAEQFKQWQGATAIWGDAAVWVPWALWHAYGDLDRLRAQYPGMVLHLRSVERSLSPTNLWDNGFQFGDWLDPDAPPDNPAAAKADPGVVATACVARSARIAAETAELIGETQDAAHWSALAQRVRDAFVAHYVSDDGAIASDCATVYALAITFDLLDPPLRKAAGDRLAEVVRAAGYRVSTGFAGTPFVTWALSETGHVEDAYALLLEQECPSWMYPISMGATTIWERWDSMLPDGTINPGEMTSFNHYALGAVADWVYQVVLGIRPDAPGYGRVRIQPTPGPGIDWARGSLATPHGTIEVSWSTADTFSLHVSLPEGLPATIVLPDGRVHDVTGGEFRI